MVRVPRRIALVVRAERPPPINWLVALAITVALAPYGAPLSWFFVLAAIGEPTAVFLPVGLGGRSAFFGVVLIALLAIVFASWRSRPSRLLAIPVGGSIGFAAPYVEHLTSITLETLSRFLVDNESSTSALPEHIAPYGEFFPLLVLNGMVAGLSAGPLFVTVLWYGVPRVR